MTPEKRQIVALLDEVRRGDATPAGASGLLRRALQPELAAAEHVYAALRDLTWSLVASRGAAPDLPDWYDVVRHAASLCRRRGHGEFAERLRGFAELLAQTGRFAERQPSEEVLSRRHVVELLRCLHGTTATPRAELAERVGLADANLSRVLKLLTLEGLVARSTSGREAAFRLTPAGEQAARRAGVAVTTPAPDPDAWWNDVPVAIAVWDGDRRAVGCNAEFRKLADAGSDDVLPDFEAWRAWLSDMARDERPLPQDGAWELRLGDTRWVHYVERRTKGGGCVVLGHDISAFKAAEQALEQQVAALVQTESRQRRDLAASEAKLVEAERKLHAYHFSVARFRTEFTDKTGAVADTLRDAMPARSKRAKDEVLLQNVRTADTKIRALQTYVRNFLEVPSGRPQDRLEILEPRRFLEEAVDAVNVLSESNYDLKFGKTKRVMAPTAAVRSALGQVLVAYRRAPLNLGADPTEGPYALHAAIKDAYLIIELKGAFHAGHDMDHLQGSFASETRIGPVDPVSWMGLDYCQMLVEETGGNLDVDLHTGITMSFPVKGVSVPKTIRAVRARRPID